MLTIFCLSQTCILISQRQSERSLKCCLGTRRYVSPSADPVKLVWMVTSAFELQQPGRPYPSQSRKFSDPEMIPWVALNLCLTSSSQTLLPNSFSFLGNKNHNTKHTLGMKTAVLKSHGLTQNLTLFSGSLHVAQNHWLLGNSFKCLTHRLTNGPTV